MRNLVRPTVVALFCLFPHVSCAQMFGWACQDKCFDAVVKWNNNKAYFFKGDRYLRYSGDWADDGYPRPIAGNWAGFPASWSSAIDAAVNWGNGKVYFFKGGRYLRYDISDDKADRGYPRPIAGNWAGFPASWSSGIDAAVNWGNGKVYFFKGDRYLRYDVSGDKADPGYPRPIAGSWAGFPASWSSGIDAAVNWGNGKVYFFKGDQYLRYDISRDKADPAYPRPIAGNWAGFAEPLRADLNETIDRMRVTVTGLNRVTRTGNMILTHYRPSGSGLYPAVVYSHGRRSSKRWWPARRREAKIAAYWVRRGFAFFISTRLGYGATGLEPDVEAVGGCQKANYEPGADVAVAQAFAAVDYAKRLPFIDKNRIILVGNSSGGLAMIAASGMKAPGGVIAALNFAGGMGGGVLHRGRPCNEPAIRRVATKAGRTAQLPMLWLYSQNDALWGPDLPKQWHRAFAEGGGRAEFHMLPPIGEDAGHSLVYHVQAWRGVVEAYLTKLGFPPVPLVNE
jgi:dienelactone hydrolase